MRYLAVLMVLGTLACAACAGRNPRLETAPSVDYRRYQGTWYDIAHIPQFYQKHCMASEARYFLRGDGKLDVVNLCRHGALDGPVKIAHGTAYPAPGVGGDATLRVRFGIFEGDYWILRLDPDYRWALVGSPDYKTLWILSRTRQLDEKIIHDLLAWAKEKGFDVAKVQREEQPRE